MTTHLRYTPGQATRMPTVLRQEAVYTSDLADYTARTRADLGLTRQQLAHLSGLTPQDIAEIEEGARPADRATYNLLRLTFYVAHLTANNADLRAAHEEHTTGARFVARQAPSTDPGDRIEDDDFYRQLLARYSVFFLGERMFKRLPLTEATYDAALARVCDAVVQALWPYSHGTYPADPATRTSPAAERLARVFLQAAGLERVPDEEDHYEPAQARPGRQHDFTPQDLFTARHTVRALLEHAASPSPGTDWHAAFVAMAAAAAAMDSHLPDDPAAPPLARALSAFYGTVAHAAHQQADERLPHAILGRRVADALLADPALIDRVAELATDAGENAG